MKRALSTNFGMAWVIEGPPSEFRYLPQEMEGDTSRIGGLQLT